jgi:hypothetical protein
MFCKHLKNTKESDVIPQALTVEEFIDLYKTGRTSFYNEIASGRLPTYRVGRRRFISSAAAAEWQRRLEAETTPTKPAADPLPPSPKPKRSKRAANQLPPPAKLQGRRQ